MLRRVLAAAALAPLAPVALATPAGAAVEERSRTTGAIVVEFAGDPARGCAEQGLCDVRGTVVAEAAPPSDGTTTSSRAQPFVRPEVLPAEVRVVRGDPDRPAGVCSDRSGGEAEAVEVGTAGPAPGAPGDGYVLLSAGRCAGPLAADVAAALPAPRVPRGFLRARRVVADLTGERPFASGPFSGTVRSTLRVTVRRRRVRSPDVGFGPAPRRPSRPSGRRRVSIGVSYDLALPGGTLELGFAGASAPLCELLDACGVEGTARVAVAARRSPFGVDVAGQDTRGVLRGRAAGPALRALRAGRLDVGNNGTSETLPARLAVELRRAGSPAACRDDRPVELALGAEADARGMTISLDGASDPFRQGARGPGGHCGGPVAGPGRLAVAHVPLALLGRRTIDLTLMPPAAPGDALASAFALRPAGGVPVRLTRRRVRVSEVPLP